MKNKLRDEDKISIVKGYIEGYSTVKLGKKYKVSPNNINGILRRRGIEIRSQSLAHRKYDIDESFFDDIDNEVKAYFLGFLYADGYNNTDRHTVSIQLHKKDVEILIKLNNLLQPEKPLQFIKLGNRYKKFANDAYRIVINNKHISLILDKLGCGQRKTFKITFPHFIEKKLMNHFIRGYFDGDGSVTHRSKGNSLFSIIGNNNFINDIQDVLVRSCSLSKTKLEIDKENKNISTVRWCGGPQIKRIGDYLYSNSSIFLERKFNVFNGIRNEYTQD